MSNNAAIITGSCGLIGSEAAFFSQNRAFPLSESTTMPGAVFLARRRAQNGTENV